MFHRAVVFATLLFTCISKHQSCADRALNYSQTFRGTELLPKPSKIKKFLDISINYFINPKSTF